MLALCVYSRGEMRQYLLENVEFRRFLDSSPQYCSILYQYDQCKFAFLLTNVRLLLQESLAFDMFLTQTRHLEKSIFDHLIVMICGPFTRISIPEMADTLGCSVNVLEEELVSLITSRTLSARIDSSAKVLLSKEVDAKVATYNKVLELGENCIREAKFNLLRMSLLESKLYLGTEERRIFGGHN